MEQQRTKIVNLSYVAAAGLVGYVIFAILFQVVGIYDLEARIKNIDLIVQGVSVFIGLCVFLYFYRSDKVNQYMHEVVAELSRVTWPTGNDTYKATIVVLVMVLLSGVFWERWIHSGLGSLR